MYAVYIVHKKKKWWLDMFQGILVVRLSLPCLSVPPLPSQALHAYLIGLVLGMPLLWDFLKAVEDRAGACVASKLRAL